MEITLKVAHDEFNYDDYDGDLMGNHADDIFDIITDKAASQIISSMSYNKRNSLEKIISDKVEVASRKIEDGIVAALLQDHYQPIAERITNRVVGAMEEKYERSKQYRELKKQFEIESDRDINSGIRALISDIVKAEVRKIIKL